tara:strand:- start:6231 stop:6521 length:291 start_codon:yes stop_codon:yes gene_type:complete
MVKKDIKAVKKEGKIVIDMNDIQGHPWVLTSVLRRELGHSGKSPEYIDELFSKLDWSKQNEFEPHLIYLFLRELGDTYMLENLTDEQIKYVEDKNE